MGRKGMRWLTVRPPGNDRQELLLMDPLHSMAKLKYVPRRVTEAVDARRVREPGWFHGPKPTAGVRPMSRNTGPRAVPRPVRLEKTSLAGSGRAGRMVPV